MPSYAELHCHSAFSLLDGASTPEALVERAAELGISTLALTDHDDLGGAVRFSRAAREAGVEAIVGAELTIQPADPYRAPSHLTLLARTAEGYGNLSELVSRARGGGRVRGVPLASCRATSGGDPGLAAALQMSATRHPAHPPHRDAKSASGSPSHPSCGEGGSAQSSLYPSSSSGEWAPHRGSPRVTWGDLEGLSGGLLALTGCPQGELARRVRAGDGRGARALLDFLSHIYGDHVAVEVWDHALPEERVLVEQLLELADGEGVWAVATNDVHYATPSGRIVHDVLTCLRHGVTLDEAGTRLRPNGEWHLKPPSVVWRRWRHRRDVVENTLALAARCSFRLADLSPAMPGFQVPPGVTRQEYLESLVWKGAIERYGGASGQRQNGDPIRVAGSVGEEVPGGAPRFMSRGFVAGGEDEPGRSKCPLGDSPGTSSKEGRTVDPAFRSRHVEGVSERTSDCDGEGAAGTPERTFGAPRPVWDRCLQSRDMKRGVPAVPDRSRAAPSRNGKLGLTQRVRRQIRHELEVIARLDLAGYFLTVWDVVRFARRRGILLQGRGSAANSCVCYCLGITAVDPIKFELLFERFLSEERGGAPDIDIDIEHERREEVLQYVYDKYQREHAAMVCETITYRGRSAVRDAARVLGFSTDVADLLAAETDRREAAEAAEALVGGGLAACGLDPADRRVRALVHVVRGLDQLPRHRSIHVGGFVLTEGALSRVVPIEPAAMKDRTVIQWDKDDLEFAGLIKIDLLGLGMLTCLAKAIGYIREVRGVAIDLAQLPANDRGVYEMIQAADTVGVFQIESRAQMNSLPRLKPQNFYDLVVQVALIRPGPIQGDMVHPYVRRRRGEEPVTYLHPDLEPILHRTLGVPLFQEQGMKVAVAMAGFTPGQADMLRRAMGFKRSREAMAAIEPALRGGMTERGVKREVQDYIVQYLTAFANYGFPESHAASFALLVYASAYLKRYYAPEFFCALLNSQPMGFYAPGTLVHDARRHGVEVRPVDLAYSAWDCTLELGVPEAPGESPRFMLRDSVAGGEVEPGRSKCPLADSPATSSEERTVDPVIRPHHSKGAESDSGRTSDRDREGARGIPGRTSDRDREGARDASERTSARDREGAAGTPERTFGARRPVRDRCPKSRDMKRGVPAAPDRPRDMKREASRAPDRPRDMKREASRAPDRPRAPALRIGLRYVRGLGSQAKEKLKAAWEAGGPFESVEDVVRRSGLGLPALKTLAEAGAFDTVWGGSGRRSALWEVLAQLARKPLTPVESKRNPRLKEMERVELIAADYMTTGLCTHGHPMEHLRATLSARGVLAAEQLAGVRSGQRVKVAGVVICRQRPGTAKGVCFITLEDETGFSNFVVYPDLFQRLRKTIVRSSVLLIEGVAQNEQNVINIQARRIRAIEPQAGADVIESHDFH